MRSFCDVFPEEYQSPSYPTQRISVLEGLFKEYSRAPEKNFFHLALIADGLRLRFLASREFHHGEFYKGYHKRLEELGKLKRQKPTSGAAIIAEWGSKVHELEVIIAKFEGKREVDEKRLHAELETEDGKPIPVEFDEYAKSSRLKYASGVAVPAKKLRELQRIGAALDDIPYVYWELSRQLILFEQTEKLAMVPRIMQVDMIDRLRSIIDLAQDDEYIQGLVVLLKDSDERTLQNHIKGHKEERESKRKEIAEKAKGARLAEKDPREIPISTINGIWAEGTELISKEDWNIVKSDADSMAALKGIFGRNVVSIGERPVLKKESELEVFVRDVRMVVQKKIEQLQKESAQANQESFNEPRRRPIRDDLFEGEIREGIFDPVDEEED